MLFKDMPIIAPILRALETEGYTHPTPIQEQAIPILLQQRDLLGCAQTGTGKTAAFSIPILQILFNEKIDHPQPQSAKVQIKALILTPTRELAIQIGESLTAYGRHTGLRHAVIFGGVSQGSQVDALRRGVDIVVATPGRLLDLMNQGYVNLNSLRQFVLDEADRMLDMGFIHDVRKVIAKLPAKRHTLFFSATMPPEISQLANSILSNPVRVEVTPASTTAEKVSQEVYFVEKTEKKRLLLHLLQDRTIRTLLVFTRTKHLANRVAQDLEKSGIRAEAIHGNKSQNARQSALSNFKAARIRVLVATDIAARGIDIDELTHVLNYELPNVPETYVHRIGRTGRAGNSGCAISFCDGEEIAYLKDIQKLIGQKVPVVEEHPYAMILPANAFVSPVKPVLKQGGGRPQQRPAAPPREKRDASADRRAFTPARDRDDNKPAFRQDDKKPFRADDRKPAFRQDDNKPSFRDDSRPGQGFNKRRRRPNSEKRTPVNF